MTNRGIGILGADRVRSRLAAGEKLRDIFFDAGGKRVAKAGGVAGSVVRSAASDRAVDFTISTGSLDRYNSTIAPDGWKLDAYRKNSVVLWSHDDSIPAIARAENTRIEGGRLRSRAIFADAATHPLADTIYRLIEGGFIGAASVGWIPLEYKFFDNDQGSGIAYLSAELLEWSVVNIPANSDCLVDARAFGVDTRPLVGWTEKALDESGRLGIPRAQLESLRTAAGAAPQFRSAGVIVKGSKMKLSVPATQRGADGRPHRWNSLGEQLRAIALQTLYLTPVDQRLVRSPTGSGEVDPSAGGFLVAPQYVEELVGFAYEEAVIAPRCDRRPTAAPLGAGVNIPAIDETSRVDGSRWGGALAYWGAEASSVTSTFPRFKNLEFDAKKLIAVMYVTGELLNDVPMLGAHARRVFSAEISWKLDLAVLKGTGAGVPQGILNSPSLITIAKETGQAAATIVSANVSKMFQALPAPSRRTAVWIVNEDVETQLEAMIDVVGTAGTAAPSATALYMPAGANGNEFALLKGRPVLVAEQCPVLGTPGDIVLADLRHYIIVERDLDMMLSVHVSFLNDQPVFRFILRVDGQSAFASPITPYNGATNLRSPFVALAAR